MKQWIIAGILIATAGLTTLMAQKPPQAKSKAELEAVQALFNQQADADTRIAAAENLLTKFADTDFKSLALYFEAFSYQQKGDSEKTIVFAERAIEANPKDYQSMLILAEVIAQHSRAFDLDLEEKLTRATKYANDAIAIVKDLPKPNATLSDAQWAEAQKDSISQAHDSLGIVATVRKKNDVAIAEFKLALDAAHPEPAYSTRLAQAYLTAGQYDDAIATAEKLLAQPNLHPTIKQATSQIRANALIAKSKAGKPAAPAAPAAAPAPPQVEVKKP
jgi:tetratricopeptide (TPR) repeat protein